MLKTALKTFSGWLGIGAAVCTLGCGNIDLADAGRRAQNTTPDVVTTWNKVAQDAIIGVAKKPGSASLIDLAIVHLAIYDAVNSIDGSHQPYLVNAAAPAGASIDAAAAQAAHDVLVGLYPSQVASFDAALATSLGAIVDGSSKTDGIAVGRAAAQGILAARANDGRNDLSVVHTFTTGPGAWQLTPPAFAAPQTPWVAKTLPFTMTAPDQFRPGPPDALSSAEYAADLNEVKTYGALNSTARTADQTEVALFWAEHSGTQYSRNLRNISMAKGLSTAERARLFAVVDTAAADSLIGCLDAKYHYAFWRPITAIRNADTDGNRSTDADATWTPLLATPNHPEYLGAHGCLTSAVMEAMAGFFGTEQVAFDLDSTTSTKVHHYRSTKDAVKEIVDARTWGGLHYRTSSVKGGDLGAKVANQLLYRYFDR